MASDDLLRRVPPHSQDAEEACIGAMFMSASAISLVREVLIDEDFYDERNRLLYAFISDLNDRSVPVDVVTVSDRLAAANLLEKAGGAAYLSRLLESVPASANVGTYARIVLEKSMLRQLINASRTIIDNIYENQNDLERIFDDAEKRIFEVTNRRLRSDYYLLKDILSKTLNEIAERHKNQHVYTGLTTGFTDLDDLTSGLQKGDLIVLAARPGMGKTAFALNIATRATQQKEDAVALFFSLEMPFPELVLRMLSTESRIEMQKIRKGQLSESQGEWVRLIGAAGELSKLNIYIDDKPMISLNEIKALSRRIKAKHGLSLVLIDHMQLITTSDSTKANVNVNRNVEISYISRSLKALAKELEVPVVVLSQLSRSVESRTDPIPRLSDLRESGAIEQDADIVAFLFRDDYYEKELSTKKGIAELMIEKHRNGPTDRLGFAFIKECVRFENLDDHSKQLLREAQKAPRRQNQERGGGGGGFEAPF